MPVGPNIKNSVEMPYFGGYNKKNSVSTLCNLVKQRYLKVCYHWISTPVSVRLQVRESIILSYFLFFLRTFNIRHLHKVFILGFFKPKFN